jgi:hypothetical protein
MKRCTMCECEKDEDNFYYDSATDRLTSMCKPCVIKYNSTKRKFKRIGRVFSREEFKRKKMYI